MSQPNSFSLSELKKNQIFVEPLLGLIMAAPTEISFDILLLVLNIDKQELINRLKIVEKFLIISKRDNGVNSFYSINNDIREFLSCSIKSKMNIDIKTAHLALADYCWKEYKAVCKVKDLYRPYMLLDNYVLYSLPHHLKQSGKMEEFNRLRNDIAYWIARYWLFEWKLEKDFYPINTPWSRKHSSYLELWDRDYFFCLMSFSSASDTVDFSMNEIVEKLSLTEFDFKSSKPWDDDCYWMAKSPFDNKYYVFAGMSAPYCRPFYILDEPPPDWDE